MRPQENQYENSDEEHGESNQEEQEHLREEEYNTVRNTSFL